MVLGGVFITQKTPMDIYKAFMSRFLEDNVVKSSEVPAAAWHSRFAISEVDSRMLLEVDS